MTSGCLRVLVVWTRLISRVPGLEAFWELNFGGQLTVFVHFGPIH